MKKQLAGMHVALMSGFSDDGKLCEKRQENIIGYTVKQNVAGLYIGGSSAEAATMSVDELLVQQKIVMDSAKGRVGKLIAHVGMPSIKDAVALAESAKELGFDALSALPPYAFPHTQEEIFNYYKAIASATDLPLIVYEVPIRTGRATPTHQIVEILDLPNVEGIKFTSNDLFALSRIKERCPDKTYFFGFDEMYGYAATSGIDGGIGTTYNVLGNLYTAINEAVIAGDLDRMRELQAISQDFVEAIIKVGVIPGVKAAMQLIGVDCGQARAPLALRGSDAMEIMKAAVAKPGFQEWIAK
ncbi:dihydrodipicolinate synthase family protein [Polycladidibacter hongkongensis]|uniref:dihydrodipicolinate synthase family protein n=1 Tax=Polycladidibacter hongkongensis TaxID=1647556 RepID=UPI00083770A5|nr:dihydrodipicolinate synthase family protein [Pseudovibrio hongkongensis]